MILPTHDIGTYRWYFVARLKKKKTLSLMPVETFKISEKFGFKIVFYTLSQLVLLGVDEKR